MLQPPHHCLFNHFPIVGSVLCLVLMIGAYFFRKRDVAKAALILVVLVALLTIPAFLSGHHAAQVIKPLPGVNREAIHAHAEFSRIAFWLLEVTGVIALLTLYINIRNHRLANALLGLTFALLVASAGAMVWTGNLGGKIRHPELEQTTAPVNNPPGDDGDGDEH